MRKKILPHFIAASALMFGMSWGGNTSPADNLASRNDPESFGGAKTPGPSGESVYVNYTNYNNLFTMMDEKPKLDFESAKDCTHKGYKRDNCEQSQAMANNPKNPLSVRPNYADLVRCEHMHGTCDMVIVVKDAPHGVEKQTRYQPHNTAGWVAVRDPETGKLDVMQSAPLFPVREEGLAVIEVMRADGERYYRELPRRTLLSNTR